MKNVKIGILGGDTRQLTVCELLSKDGAECALWTTDPNRTKLCGVTHSGGAPVKCVDVKSALSGADAVVLPLPLTTDGVRLNCARGCTSSDSYIPRITEIIENTDRGCVLLAGKIPAQIMRLAAEHGIRMIDYYEFESFQIKNAVPTAEGAIAVAIDELDVTLHGSRIGVAGYGRIGRTLAQRLLSLGANVTCIARSKRDLAWAECDGCETVSLDKFRSSPLSFDALFNTVPHIIFDGELLSKMNGECIIIDLASQNGGVEVSSAEQYGVRVVKALSLPGKCSPKTAGRIIYSTVKHVLKEEGVL